MFTLQDCDQPGADARHDVAEQPLSDLVAPQPADDGQEGQRCLLGPFGITSAERRREKTSPGH